MSIQCRYFVVLISLAFSACPAICEDNKSITIDKVVSALLCSDKECHEEVDWLVGLKEKSAPIFLQLLSDPKPIDDYMLKWDGSTHPEHVLWSYRRIFAIVKLWKNDRAPFLRPALENLIKVDHSLRERALALLAEIATERDAPPISVLLHNREDGFYASNCLAVIGGPNELIAFDAIVRANRTRSILNGEKYRDQNRYEAARDKLKARLDALAAKAKPVTPPVIDEIATPLKRILTALNDDTDAGKADRAWLAELKDKAFPAYHHVLRDPKTKPACERELFRRLKATAGDRAAFVPFALARLAHEDVDLRIAALNLLQDIGSSRDSSPVVALLGDERQIVSDLAVETLVAIGGENDLIALDIWLQGVAAKYEPNGLPRFYFQQRANLQARVEKVREKGNNSKK